jgi:hypothetical protein
MVHARRSCQLFNKAVDSIFHPLYWPLLNSIAICYSRPFVKNNGVGILSSKWARFENPEYGDTHKSLLKIRHELIAHNDVEIVQVKMLPPGCSFEGRKHKGPGVDHALSRYALPLRKFESIWHTIEEQRIRLMRAIDAEKEALYGTSQLPETPFQLDFTEGL